MSDSRAYDTPKSIQNMNYDSPRTQSRLSSYSYQMEDSYDVPRSNLRIPHANSLLKPFDSLMEETSNASTSCHYEIPKKSELVSRAFESSIESLMYDIPSQANGSIRKKELNYSIALESFEEIGIELMTVSTRLIGFISADWRSEGKLKLTITSIKSNVDQFVLTLNKYIDLTAYVLDNAAKVDDRRFYILLEPLNSTLVNVLKSVQDAVKCINSHGWSIDRLKLCDGNAILANDSLDQIINCVGMLIEDSHFQRVKSFLQNENTFRKSAANDTNHSPLMISSHEVEPVSFKANPNDKPFIMFYGTQIVSHIKYISKAVDAFLQSVERNQPPKYFLTYGKFVILNAFNVINAGDIIYRNISKSDLRSRVLERTNALTDAIKNFINKTKRAAQHFPSVIAVQEMVDSVIKVSHLSYELKLAILHVLND